MSAHSSSPRPLVLPAALFALTTSINSCIWVYYTRIPPRSVVGVVFWPFYPELKQLHLVRVSPGSLANHAGLRAGDRIVAINGLPLDQVDPRVSLALKGNPGSTGPSSAAITTRARFSKIWQNESAP